GLEYPKPGYKVTQLKAIYSKDRPDVRECMRKMDEVHARMVDLLLDPLIKGPMKAGGKLHPELAKTKGMGFAKLIPFPKDKLTDEPDVNKNPVVYYKLVSFESSKTTFSRITVKGDVENLT